MIRGYSGKQPGDPVRARRGIVKAVEAPDAPLRLMLGKAALAAGRAKVLAMDKDFESWAAVSEGADFPIRELPSEWRRADPGDP